jgi:hypothetical protein
MNAENAAVPVDGLAPGDAVLDRSVADIDAAILAAGEADNPAGLAPGVAPGVSVPGDEVAAVAKSPEKVLKEFSLLVGLALRLIKGVFAPAWKIEKNDFDELRDLWADYLSEEFPEGVPATKLGIAIMATGALIGQHADTPRFAQDAGGQKVGFFRGLFQASVQK